MMKNFIESKMKDILATYTAKAQHYGKFDNFKKGAYALYGSDDWQAMFKAARAYQAKHIAFLNSHTLNNATLEEWNESLGDIINYCFIMLYFANQYSDEEYKKRIDSTSANWLYNELQTIRNENEDFKNELAIKASIINKQIVKIAELQDANEQVQEQKDCL